MEGPERLSDVLTGTHLVSAQPALWLCSSKSSVYYATVITRRVRWYSLPHIPRWKEAGINYKYIKTKRCWASLGKNRLCCLHTTFKTTGITQFLPPAPISTFLVAKDKKEGRTTVKYHSMTILEALELRLMMRAVTRLYPYCSRPTGTMLEASHRGSSITNPEQ